MIHMKSLALFCCEKKKKKIKQFQNVIFCNYYDWQFEGLTLASHSVYKIKTIF